MNRSIAIIGASGLLGQAFVRYFEKKNTRIALVSRTPLQLSSNNFVHYTADINDLVKIDEVVKDYDIIINCTGQITYPINECLVLNSTGILNLVKLVKKYEKHLIHFSSVTVYGTNRQVDETTTLNPESVYGALKAAAELLIINELNQYCIMRVSNLYGPYQMKGIISYLLRSYQSNSPELHFNNDGSLRRYYLHTDDLVEITDDFIKSGSEGVYNVVGPEKLTVKELISIAQRELKYKFFPTYTTDSPVENIDTIDSDKLQKEISYEYKYSLANFFRDVRANEKL